MHKKRLVSGQSRVIQVSNVGHKVLYVQTHECWLVTLIKGLEASLTFSNDITKGILQKPYEHRSERDTEREGNPDCTVTQQKSLP